MKSTISIAQPPWTGLGKKLESATRKALHEFNMVEESTSIAIALSGGKDSLTLLFLLKAISGRGFPPFKLTAINVGGEFTCGAAIGEDFLKATCDALEVPLITAKSTKTLDNLECYSCSRERRSLLFAAAKEAGCSIIAFGHHRDDSAQTLLMNLLHKGEFAGLLPKLFMHQYDITIIRPLIYVEEEDIRQFAKQYGFARLTCRCPVGQASLRKKTEEMLQYMETLYPNARANIASAGLMYGSNKAMHM
ncbi:MAG: tRNA 2-thiocytidine biosynthesis protein TtcA [Verrucomicrobia bacterium]|nr:tRNA 2-thiocytidine biosynthesis protein TtcA [Verrucomicrobiota bacterium]